MAVTSLENNRHVDERYRMSIYRSRAQRIKDINSPKGRSDTRCFKMETAEQCILGTRQYSTMEIITHRLVVCQSQQNTNQK